MANPETILMNKIRAAVDREGTVRLFRNNVGRISKDGRWIVYGLAVGSADLVGLKAPSGRFFALEIKTPDAPKAPVPEQKAWGDTITRFGGVYAVVRSVEEALAVVRGIQ